jgi:outer membrane protein TolC
MYELGMGTYDSVLAAQNGVATLELTIRSLEGSLETLKRQIAVFVGMGADDPFRIKEFQGYAAEELDTVLEGLNKETDLVAARSNSYDLKLQTLTASRGSSNMEKANSYRKDDLRARFNIAFGQMYDDLFIKKAGIEQAASAYALKERDYEIAQKKYELGMLSSMELESAATALEKSGLELTARHLDFAVAVNRYEAMKNGVWFES